MRYSHHFYRTLSAMHYPAAGFARVLIAALLLALVFEPRLGHAQTESADRRAEDARAAPRPVQELPAVNELLVGNSHLRGQLDGPEMSNVHVLHRLGRIYSYQADLLMAEADGDDEAAANLLELAMNELVMLMQEQGVADMPRVQELYRSVLTEYEWRHGSSDTLAFQYGDIFEVRGEMFAAMNAVETPLLEDVVSLKVEPVGTTIPMTMNRLVEQSTRYLLKSPEKHLYRWLSRAETYFPMVEQILEEEGVPDELKYLAMIESGLNPTARSWAHAGGMWQFIAATGRAYDLDVNSWVDERLDPEKATRAAARHLRDLYEMFDGDWHLALSGYNCSPSRIRRALRRAESRLGRKATFWDIYNDIPRETRNYVPMFIATALLASNPDAHGLQPVKPGPRYEYDYVPVQGMLDFETIASMAGTSTETIRALNPELKRASTPPSTGHYFVRIPLGTSEQFLQKLAELPPSARKSAKEYVVRRGDSLGKIASRYGVSVREIQGSNGIRGTVIHPGQVLVIPVPVYEQKAVASLAKAEPVRVQYGKRAIRPISVQKEKPEAGPARQAPVVATSHTTGSRGSTNTTQKATSQSEKGQSQTRVVYTVRRGDSLTKIGSKYGVSVAQLKSWNSLRSSRIQVGQRLYLYTDGAEPAANDARQVTEHRVRRGDSLGKIASRYGVTVSQLKQWNGLRSSTIHPGQRLVLSGEHSLAQNQVTHRVRRGDSLGKIARRYGVSVSQLKDWNGLNGNTIYPGQRLKIRT